MGCIQASEPGVPVTIMQFLRALDKEDQESNEPLLFQNLVDQCSPEVRENIKSLGIPAARASLLITCRTMAGDVRPENYQEFVSLCHRLMFRSGTSVVKSMLSKLF